mmetsp:Transcript_29403/g.65835  ORF Transcript_29403/g.65835 Transcript_29403/m.65835 type:complete len:209 (+) Transcript_29403:78-704(+)
MASDLLGDEDDFCFAAGGSTEDQAFDAAVGAIEGVLLDPGFVQLQASFCDVHCDEFDDTDENKLSYTPVFEQYTAAVESYLSKRVGEEIEGFDLDAFGRLVSARPQEEVTGDVFDLLLSLGDFAEFKDLMLAHKREKALATAAATGLRGGAGLEGLLHQCPVAAAKAPPTSGLSGLSGQGRHMTPRAKANGRAGAKAGRDESKFDLSP